MPKHVIRGLFVVAVATLAVSPAGSAAADAKKGKARKKVSTQYIIDRVVERSPFGFVSGTGNIDMILLSSSGAKRERTLLTKSIREDGLGRLLIRFRAPSSVRGTSVLMYQNDASEDDTFLYLPAFRRTRRIAGGDKRNAFVGSDFSYYDMEHYDVYHARHKRQPDTEIDGDVCYHIIAYPKDKSTYSKLDIYVRKKDFLTRRIKYYDRTGNIAKVYRILKTTSVDGEPVASKSQMWTKKTDHSTFFVLKKLNTKNLPKPTEFDKRNLSTL